MDQVSDGPIIPMGCCFDLFWCKPNLITKLEIGWLFFRCWTCRKLGCSSGAELVKNWVVLQVLNLSKIGLFFRCWTCRKLGCSSGAKLVKNWVVLHEVFKSTFWLRFLLFWKHEDCYIARRCGSISRKEFSQYLASKIHCKLENENVTFSLSLGRHIFGALSQPDSCNNWGSVNL
jgi:hypothetical protein